MRREEIIAYTSLGAAAAVAVFKAIDMFKRDDHRNTYSLALRYASLAVNVLDRLVATADIVRSAEPNERKRAAVVEAAREIAAGLSRALGRPLSAVEIDELARLAGSIADIALRNAPRRAVSGTTI